MRARRGDRLDRLLKEKKKNWKWNKHFFVLQMGRGGRLILCPRAKCKMGGRFSSNLLKYKMGARFSWNLLKYKPVSLVSHQTRGREGPKFGRRGRGGPKFGWRLNAGGRKDPKVELFTLA